MHSTFLPGFPNGWHCVCNAKDIENGAWPLPRPQNPEAPKLESESSAQALIGLGFRPL